LVTAASTGGSIAAAIAIQFLLARNAKNKLSMLKIEAVIISTHHHFT